MIEGTIDHAGPMARNAEGVARLLQAIVGTDPLDPRQCGVTPPGHDFDYLSKLKDGVKGKRIAIVREGEVMSRALQSRPNVLPQAAVMALLTTEFLQETQGNRYYWKAQNQRYLINAAYDLALQDFDILAMPTTRFPATVRPPPDSPLLECIGFTLNMLCNSCVADVTDHPPISLPCGKVDGLPVGLMLAAFETLRDWQSM